MKVLNFVLLIFGMAIFSSSCNDYSGERIKILSHEDSVYILSKQFNTLAHKFGLAPYVLTDNNAEVLNPKELIDLIKRTKATRQEKVSNLREAGLSVLPNDIDSNQVCYRYTYVPPLTKNLFVVEIRRFNDSVSLISSRGKFDYECIIPDSAKTTWTHNKKNINIENWKQFEKIMNKSYLLDLRSTYNYQCTCGDYLNIEFAQKASLNSSLRYYSNKPQYKSIEILCPNNTDINNACKYLARLTGDDDFWFPVN